MPLNQHHFLKKLDADWKSALSNLFIKSLLLLLSNPSKGNKSWINNPTDQGRLQLKNTLNPPSLVSASCAYNLRATAGTMCSNQVLLYNSWALGAMPIRNSRLHWKISHLNPVFVRHLPRFCNKYKNFAKKGRMLRNVRENFKPVGINLGT